MIRALAAVLVGAIVALPASAGETPPAPGTPRDFALPGRETLQLDNGLSITFIDYGRVPKVTLLAAVRTGTIDEGSDTWLADLTAEMLKEGTSRRSAAELARRAAEMGGGLFANAGDEQTTVGISVLSEHAADAAALIAEVLREPQLPESELPRILGSFQRRLSVAKSDPGSLADEALAQLAWGDHPFGRSFPTEAQLAAYTVDDVRRFHAANFGARRTHVYVAGRYDRPALEAALKQAFSGWAAGPEPTSNPPVLRRGPALRFVDRPGAPQSVIRLALPAPDPSAADWMPFSLMNTLLGGAFSSRITTNIREDKGYAYSPGSSVFAYRRAAAWVQEADVTTADTAAALREIMGEVRRLAAEAPGADELVRIQNYRAGLFVVQNSSPTGVLGQLAFLDLHGLPAEYLTRWVANVFAVTPADITAMAARWLDLSQFNLVVVGDLAKIESELRALPELADAGPR
ncbi:MAG: insulinase family protein [Steroidobacteraceae bacterium]|jgi:predicted Zn-dependent peptidase|nr:insulinase family protein [Steroidobacteraceae bacterium]